MAGFAPNLEDQAIREGEGRPFFQVVQREDDRIWILHYQSLVLEQLRNSLTNLMSGSGKNGCKNPCRLCQYQV